MRILYWDNGKSDNPLDSFMGIVGQSTDLTDSCGNKLCVGDIILSVWLVKCCLCRCCCLRRSKNCKIR